MSSESPVVEIYSSDGYELSVKTGVAIPTGTRGVLLVGSDGTDARFATIKAPSTPAVASDPALVVILSPNQLAIPVTTSPVNSTPNLSFGDVILSSSGTTSPIERTTYTEQNVNFTGSVKSTSANDAISGTGARTMTIYYVDATGTTAGTEMVTLNGTTAVPLTINSKCFIEKMIINTIGSGGVSAGTISLFVSTGGTGTVVGSIQAGDNQTFWAHHYVVSGKTCYVTDITHSNSSTVSGGASTASLKVIPIGLSNQAEVQVSDIIGIGGATNGFQSVYGSTIKAAGPARLRMYTTTSASASNTYRGSFNSYDQ